MRVVIAPNSFDGALTAVEAARAIATGWSRWAPDDELDLRPMSDGGRGFGDVVHEALGGSVLSLSATSTTGTTLPASAVITGDAAYLEAAQVCGKEVVDDVEPQLISSFAVGQLIRAAVEAGSRHIVVGVGGTRANDGGAGLLAALGATSSPADALGAGARGLAALTSIDVTPARRLLDGVNLVALTDVDTPLLGLRGIMSRHGAERGLSRSDALEVDGWLTRLAELIDRDLANSTAAGAGGGSGFGLMALGARTRRGVDFVAGEIGLVEVAKNCDLVVTGEADFDFRARAASVPSAVAEIAGSAIRPCVVVAMRVVMGAREMRAMGVESAYSVEDLVGWDAALTSPDASLTSLAERVARTWSPRATH